jgi:hypothetical protein
VHLTIYIYVHDYIFKQNVEQYIYKYAKFGFTSKNGRGGLGEDAAPPRKKIEYGTQGVYTGQHASCDHIYGT